MKKLIMLIAIFTNMLISTNIIKGVKANEDVTKPLVLLVGGQYDNYFNVDGYEIINNNVNTNKCGNYSITYKNNTTQEIFEKKVYVKDEQELLSDKCYAENYQTMFSSNNRINTTKVIQSGVYTYISFSEEISENVYNLRFLKLMNEEVILDKLIMENVNAEITDFILADEEIVFLINKTINSNQDVYIKTISYDGEDIYEDHLEGNNYDYGLKIQEERDVYFFIIETSSNSGSIYNEHYTTSYITLYTINKFNKIYLNIEYIVNEYDVKYVDMYASRFGLLVLYKYYNSDIKLTYHVLKIFDSIDGSFLDIRTLSANIGEEYSKLKEADNGEVYYIVTKYSNELGTNEYSLYKLNSQLNKTIINTYHYEKRPNLIFADYLVYDKNNFTMLFSLVDLTKEDPYGYLYQIYDNGNISLEIENYSSTMITNGFLDKDTLLFTNDKNIIINDIEYLILTMLNNDITTSSNTISIYPILYINGDKVELDINKSMLNYDINTHGLYNVIFYFTHNKMDVAICGTINVEAYSNIKYGEIYDKNLKLTFTGEGILNDQIIETGYIVTKPGTYILEIKGVNDLSYEFEFVIEEISYKGEILVDDEIELTANANKKLSSNKINLNNNIKESDVNNNDKNYNWTLLIPLSAGIIFIFSLFKKRG